LAKLSRLSLCVEGLLRRLQQLSLEVVSDDSRLLVGNRLAYTAARVVVAVLSNGVDRLTRDSLDSGQRSEGVSVHVEKMMNPTVRTVTVGSSVLDGLGSVGSDSVLLGRKVVTVGLRPGVQVEGAVAIADESVKTCDLAGNGENFEAVVQFAHLVREHSSR
jgi:hypothetical protein